ncbi:MAG: flagellar basal body rod protein FlgB [Spirochaetaceae bacterium]|nr:flagellar basal body rod protein FlgB [Spirochaetaceae bacterium]
MNTFTKSVDLLHRAMDVSTLRYQVSANNLANAEVPNFKRTSVNFESQLKKALESEEKAADSFQMITTDSRHIQSEGAIDYRTVEPRRVTDYLTTSKANGNNVDAEQEAMEILKTQMNYQLLTQMQAFEFSQVKIAMQKL